MDVLGTTNHDDGVGALWRIVNRFDSDGASLRLALNHQPRPMVNQALQWRAETR
jgi:hypothetical protein